MQSASLFSWWCSSPLETAPLNKSECVLKATNAWPLYPYEGDLENQQNSRHFHRKEQPQLGQTVKVSY